MKYCYACKKELELDVFSINRSKPDGFHDACKECKKEMDKKYRIENLEKIKLRHHQYYLKNKNAIIERTTDYIKSHRVESRIWSKKVKIKLKKEVFSHYCGGTIKCNLCEESNLVILTLDHKNGGGNKHRKESGMQCGYNSYRWVRKHGYPEIFRILCFNCQFRTRIVQMKSRSPTKRQLQTAAYARSVKVQCLEKYGKICPCGCTDLDVLTLDHVNDDGKKHREDTGKVGFGFYIYLRKNGYSNDPPLQVMCMNCQFLKRDGKLVTGENDA